MVTMKIITICGSMRYTKEMLSVAEKIELEGNVVLLPLYNSSQKKKIYTKAQYKVLEAVHKERIKLAETILVVNIDNYIGESTNKEIEFAKKLGKEIIYYTDLEK